MLTNMRYTQQDCNWTIYTCSLITSSIVPKSLGGACASVACVLPVLCDQRKAMTYQLPSCHIVAHMLQKQTKTCSHKTQKGCNQPFTTMQLIACPINQLFLHWILTLLPKVVHPFQQRPDLVTPRVETGLLFLLVPCHHQQLVLELQPVVQV